MVLNNLISVVGLHYLLYLPVVLNTYFTFSWKFYGIHIFVLLLASNGVASPLVYIWQNYTFRRQMALMFGLKNVTRTRRKHISLLQRNFAVRRKEPKIDQFTRMSTKNYLNISKITQKRLYFSKRLSYV